MGSRTCCSCGCGGPRAHIVFLLLCPCILAVVLFIASVEWKPVWVYTTNGVKYEIGARGYSTTSIDGLSGPTWLYTTPTSWPKPISALPGLLVVHFALAILLSLFLVVFIPLVKVVTKKKVYQAICRDSKTIFVGGTLALFVLALGAADAVVYAQAKGDGLNVEPTPLGWILMIVLLLLAIVWIIFLVAARTYKKPEKYVTPSGETYKRDHSRSEKAPGIWQRLTKGK